MIEMWARPNFPRLLKHRKYSTMFHKDLDPDDPTTHYSVTYTEQEIIDEYFDFWYIRMVKKFGVGHHLITRENCIDDWIVSNWAWEV